MKTIHFRSWWRRSWLIVGGVCLFCDKDKGGGGSIDEQTPLGVEWLVGVVLVEGRRKAKIDSRESKGSEKWEKKEEGGEGRGKRIDKQNQKQGIRRK